METREIMEFKLKAGRVISEVHEVTEITEGELPKKTRFFKCEEPCYMQIFFHDRMDEEDYTHLYAMCLGFDLFQLTCPVGDMIADDLENGPVDCWNIKCYNFENAFKCAVELTDSPMGREHRISVHIMDSPSEEWLVRKEVNADGN